ncbi:OmpA family protein [Dyadobacter subterraneus]|nr:OmpA family protein [Dyadobacter subterraneus]
MKLFIYFLSITSLYAQCGFLEGTVTDVSGSKPLVATVFSKSEQGKTRMGKTSEKGMFRFEIPCDLSALVIESKGYQSLTVPVYIDQKNDVTFFVPLKLLPIGKQTKDEPYAQSEQTHLVLKDSTTSVPKIIRRILVEDAISKEILPANICLYYTHKQARECFDLTKSDPGIEIAFPENDIVAMEVKSPGYQSYNGNLILDQAQDSTRTYTLKLNRQHTILSVNIANPHAGLHARLREGNGENIEMERVNNGHFYTEAAAGRIYKLELTGQNRNIELATAMASLKEGITLKSFRLPAKDSLKPEKRTAEAFFTVENRTLYFPQSDYKLPPDSENYLDSLAEWISANKDKSLSINGYTDNVGNASLNLTLSEYRVRVITRYLVNKGVDENRIKAQGLGSKFPVAPNDTEKNRRKNRRVEVQIIDLPERTY